MMLISQHVTVGCVCSITRFVEFFNSPFSHKVPKSRTGIKDRRWEPGMGKVGCQDHGRWPLLCNSIAVQMETGIGELIYHVR